MTTPEPARAASAVPLAQAHAELVADLTRALDRDAGLARILAIPAAEVPVDAGSSTDAAAFAVEPRHGAHAALVADLEANLHLPEGLQDILDAESGHAGLVTDLSVAIDTARGLADILESPPTSPPQATPAKAGPTSGPSASTRKEQTVEFGTQRRQELLGDGVINTGAGHGPSNRRPTHFHKVIGIDLGTTYSAVSIWDGKDIRIIESALGHPIVPSVVGLDPEGRVIVGVPALNNLVSDPANTITDVKRQMGTYDMEPSGLDYTGVPRRIRFGGRDYLPQEISAIILMELKRQAEEFVGEPIHDAVITVPAYFKDPQRGATEDAAWMARLNVRRLLNEPTAAAVCFGADQVEDERTHTYAVYDLGGGTFDVSIIQVSPGNVSVVGTGGDPRLGGGDFDDRITGYVLQYIKDKHNIDLTQDPVIWQRVKLEAEARKRELSVANVTTLHLPFLTPTLSVNVPLTRATFEALIADLLQRTLECLDQAIESARESNAIEPDEIEQVLLVGGSTRIAAIRPMLAEHLGLDPKDIRRDINPDQVVARGAGMVAREFWPSEGFVPVPEDIVYAGLDGALDLASEAAEGALILQDVTSYTLGILAYRGDRAEMVPILPKDSRIPCEKSQDGFTNRSAATEIDVLIFQGENEAPFDNDLIGRLPIVLPEAKEQGHYQFEVTFSLDVHGLLNVAVKCLNDGQLWQTDVQCNVRATKEQIEHSAAQLREAMAAPAGQDETEAAAAVATGSLPKPPTTLLKPPEGLPTPPGQTGAAIVPPYPPAGTPDEFKAVTRRSFKLIGQLTGADRERLANAYEAFVRAVEQGSADVEDLGDALDDVFHELRLR